MYCLDDGFKVKYVIHHSLPLSRTIPPSLARFSPYFTFPPSLLLPSSLSPYLPFTPSLSFSSFSLRRTVRNWRPRRFGGGLGGRKGVKSRKEIEVSVACHIVICSCPIHPVKLYFLSFLYDYFFFCSLSVLLHD